MIIIYNILLIGYAVILKIASIFNDKAKLWVDGRKNWRENLRKNLSEEGNRIWFHFASLGEFEQGRPVIERWKAEKPDDLIFITFFSPSGYEIRKKYPLAEYVTYLPMDSAKNAKDFIKICKPTIAIFTKYEYWFHYYSELKKQKIPFYLISAIFRENQPFFKWYGSLHKSMLRMLDHLFVQDENSKLLLSTIGIKHVTIAGDTRFDRVWSNYQNNKIIPEVIGFLDNKPCWIAGSSWPIENIKILKAFEKLSNWKLIIAPHEIEEKNLVSIIKDSMKSIVRFSNYSVETDFKKADILLLDTIGHLSSVYQYCSIAYIGGGFGKGLHNTLEAAVAGIPIIIGPNYEKFKEAKELVRINAAFVLTTMDDLDHLLFTLISDKSLRESAGINAKKYVESNTGATEKILKIILN